jgi:hypothetical protein
MNRWYYNKQLHAFAFTVVVMLIVAAIVFVAPYKESHTIARGAESFDELASRFASLAEEKGAVYAFEILKRADLPPGTDTHLLGHVVGDELYKQRGSDGIADCTHDFRNACSHTIVIGIMNEYGGASVPLIREACKKAPGGPGAYTMCFHGLGHGVFAYFGYDLDETVAFCRGLGTEEYNNREYIECIGGSIMELMGGGGHDREAWLDARGKYLTDDPLSPCMSDVIVDESAKEICLDYLTPRIWERAGIDLGRPDPNLFPKAFRICNDIPEERTELRRACFGGFGKEFVPLAGNRDIRRIDELPDEVYKRAIEWCELALVPEGEQYCVLEAFDSVFWGGENDETAAKRFCSLVSPRKLQDACFMKMAENVNKYLTGEEHEKACALVPSPAQDVCAGVHVQ